MRKAVYFSVDALLASSLVLLAVFFIAQPQVLVPDTQQLEFISDDLLLSYNNIVLSEINSSFIEQLVNETSLTYNDSLLYAMSILWVLNDSRLSNLTDMINSTLPEGVSIRLSIDDILLFERTYNTDPSNKVVSVQQITGVDDGKPLSGASSSAHLKKIRDKITSSFAYFGGFVGQGNISVPISISINNYSDITSVILELDVDQDFNLFINNNQCQGVFTPVNVDGEFTPDVWDISNCSVFFTDDNIIDIRFLGSLSNSFVGGGFLRVDYTTDTFQETSSYGFGRYVFPGIDGIINLYDSILFPGRLKSLDLYLHYNISGNNTPAFFVTIGNTTVYFDSNSSGEKFVTLLNNTLNLSINNQSTVPLRVGFQNLTYQSVITGSSDVFIVTDVSGSMDWRMDADYSSGVARNCDSSSLNDSSTKRISVAKCLDIEFVDNVLNYSGNRVGLVSYESSTHEYESVPLVDDRSVLTSVIGTSSPMTGYVASGGTCICCGINTAHRMLSANQLVTNVFSSGDSWFYQDSYLSSEPPADSQGDPWYSLEYDVVWPEANAILGATNSEVYSPLVSTELNSQIAGNTLDVDLWESSGDVVGPPVDFSSGVLNMSSNSYGLFGLFDGWDFDVVDGVGPFGYDDDVSYLEVVNGELVLDFGVSGSNRCSNRDCSGAYGISLNITDEMISLLSSGGRMYLSFDYAWDKQYAYFENNDQVWVKARLSAPSGDSDYLGFNLDSGHSGGDSDLEIFTVNNPNTDFSDFIFLDVTDYFDEGAGVYYLELGGKLRASWSNEFGKIKFDNIMLYATNSSDNYYFRKVFYVNDSLVDVDLWESSGDVVGPPVDFSSGVLNMSSNSYGLFGLFDGWDFDVVDGVGPFGYDDDVSYLEVVNGELVINTSKLGSNRCSNYDCSGAYGISLNITDEIISRLSAGDDLILYFDYAWTPGTQAFESSDQVWVKARFTSSSGSDYLGEDLDSGHSGGDSDLEIFTVDNPDFSFRKTAFINVTPFVSSAGVYYLELGFKLRASAPDEYGVVSFDNIRLRAGGLAPDIIGKGILSLLVDDRVRVYVNGQDLLVDSDNFTASYWSKSGVVIPNGYIKSGKNVIAVQLINQKGAAKFDAALSVTSDPVNTAILVMSDGQATYGCSEQSTGDPSSDAVLAACQAASESGIVVHSVGFSSTADEDTLESIAACGNGLFNSSSNVDALSDFYVNVAFSILEASLRSQSLVISGSYPRSTLFYDSYINFSYEPLIPPPEVSDIELSFQSEPFDSCNPVVNIPEGIRLAEAYVTSYSGNHWTHFLSVNGNTIFDLGIYNQSYINLGDPYRISIPVDKLFIGSNDLVLLTGDSPSNSTGCSKNNTLIYRAYAESATSRTQVLPDDEGCTWSIESESYQFTNVTIPVDYTGNVTCSYTNSSIYYNVTSAVQLAVFELLKSLDYDSDGRIIVNLDAEDLQIVVTKIDSIPYLWGPVFVKLEVFK